MHRLTFSAKQMHPPLTELIPTFGLSRKTSKPQVIFDINRDNETILVLEGPIYVDK